MAKPLRVLELLSTAEVGELEAFARERRRTIDELHEWLLARGFTLSRSAVANWRDTFDAAVAEERFGRSSELARAMKEAVKGGSFDDVADAAVMQLTQVVFEQATRLEAEQQLDPVDLQRMTRSLANLVGSKVGLVKILANRFDREIEAKQAKRQDRAISPEDIAEARKAIFGD